MKENRRKEKEHRNGFWEQASYQSWEEKFATLF